MAEDASDVEAWQAKTSAFDRVRSVAEAASKPLSVAHIAEEARVSEDTAREHLERLEELSVLLKSEHEETTRYASDPLYSRLQTLRDLIDNNDRDELVALKDDLQDEIREWRNEYGVDSPEGLRKFVADTNTAAETRDIQHSARNWELVSYRLSIVEEALDYYARYCCDSQA